MMTVPTASSRSRALRILVSSSTFPVEEQPGLPRFVFDLADSMAREAEVVALAPDAPDAPRQERIGAVDVRRFTYFLPRRWQRLAYGHGMRRNLRHLPTRAQVPAYLMAQILATRRILRRSEIDVINSHWLVPQGLSSVLARGGDRRTAHVLSVHAADVYLLRDSPLGRSLARFVLKRTDFVFADGTDVRDQLDALLGRPSRAEIQPMGVHARLFREAVPPDDEEISFPEGYLLFFGRFAEKKGITYLLRAMPRILEHHPGVGLVLVGYGALEGELVREAASLGLESRVRFVGAKPHSEVARYLAGCRLAVVPSIVDRNGETDGMPTVVVEAMAAGARVVGTAVDGIPDVVRHGENGWLCRPEDPEDLAEKALMALHDPPSSAIIAGARETGAALDWSCVAGRYLEAFRSVQHQRDR